MTPKDQAKFHSAFDDILENTLADEITKEWNKTVMEMVARNELTRIQEKYYFILECKDAWINQEIPEYVEFIMNFEIPEYKYDSDGMYFDVQGLESDLGQILSTMCEQDQFTYTMNRPT